MDFPALPLTRKRILVIEADPRAAKTIVESLEIEDYTVQLATDAQEALRYMQQLRPDLILADSHTASVNGTNLYQSIRSHPQWTTIPFILLADRHHLNEIQQAKEQGVEDYLLKPVDTGSLARIVHARLLRSAELQIALIDQAYLETIEVLANTVEMPRPLHPRPYRPGFDVCPLAGRGDELARRPAAHAGLWLPAARYRKGHCPRSDPEEAWRSDPGGMGV